jgi:hypothetical protein
MVTAFQSCKYPPRKMIFVPVNAMKACRGRWCIDPLVFNFTFRPFYPQYELRGCTTDLEALEKRENCFLCSDTNSDRPARSVVSILSYPGPYTRTTHTHKCV